MGDVSWATLSLPALVSSGALVSAVIMTARWRDPGECRCWGLNIVLSPPSSNSYVKAQTANWWYLEIDPLGSNHDSMKL